MSQPSSTEKSLSSDKIADETNSWGNLRRPGQAAPAREGTPALGPASPTAPAAQQVLRRGTEDVGGWSRFVPFKASIDVIYWF